MSHQVGRFERGFTFIELMMSVAILGTIALMAVPMAEVMLQRKREHDLRVALIEIRKAIDAYKRASEQGRIFLKINETGYPPNLDVLEQGVVDQRSPTGKKIYFLRRVPADPMTPNSTVAPARSWGLRSYASPPDEPAEGRDIFDVYSKSEGVGLNGVPYRRW